MFLNTQPDRFPSRSPSEINATLVRRSLPGAPLGTSPRGIPTSPYTKRYPYPAHSTSIDRFPSFIVIASPSVIATNFEKIVSSCISDRGREPGPTPSQELLEFQKEYANSVGHYPHGVAKTNIFLFATRWVAYLYVHQARPRFGSFERPFFTLAVYDTSKGAKSAACGLDIGFNLKKGFTPVLAKHSKNFSIVDAPAIGVRPNSAEL